MIAFRLEPMWDGYVVEADDEDTRARVFADFVNHDLLGTTGVEEMLAIAREVRAGTRRPLEQQRNVCEIELAQEGVEIANPYTGQSARSSLDDFVSYLERILAALDGQHL